jgi:hypothetical protein
MTVCCFKKSKKMGGKKMNREETIFAISTIGQVEKIKVGSTDQVTGEVITRSDFYLVENDGTYPRRLVSIMNSLGDISVHIWERTEKDEVYRWKVDVCVGRDYSLILSQIMRDGSERRIDLKMVF